MAQAWAARQIDGVALEVVDEPTERAWDDLALARGASPFLRPGWLRAATKAFRPGTDLTALTVRRAGSLVGVLPVSSGRQGLRDPISAEAAVLDMVAADEDAARRLAGAMVRQGFGRVDLRFLPADGVATTSLLDSARRRGLPTLYYVLRRSPYVNCTDGWGEYERQHLGTSQRKSIARRWRRLADIGQATLDIRDGREDPDALDSVVAEGFAVEARSWKTAAGTAVLSRPSTTAFYHDVARWAAVAGILRLVFVRLDGRAIGFQFALQQGSTLYAVKCGYDDNYSRFAPGILVVHGTVKHAFADRDVSTVLIMGEDEPYKLAFAHGSVEQVRLQIFDRDWMGRIRRTTANAQYEARQVARRRLPEHTRQHISGVLARLGG